MKINKRKFKQSTNFSFSISIWNVLKEDGERFGYSKNNNVNISGFLNSLIPTLSHYREDVHSKFVKYNNGNEETALLVERNIFNVYLKTFDLNDDAIMNVPFRISKKYKSEFIYIHDVLLEKYNMNFTSYIRTLLNEYCSKRVAHRELFYYYDKIQIINDNITDQKECNFYSKDGNSLAFVPMFIDAIDESNYICGVILKDYNPTCFKISELDNIIELDKKITCKNLDYDNIYKICLSLMKKENGKCLDLKK